MIQRVPTDRPRVSAAVVRPGGLLRVICGVRLRSLNRKAAENVPDVSGPVGRRPSWHARPWRLGLFRGMMLVAAPMLAMQAAVAHPGVGIVMDRTGAIFYTDLAQVWRIGPDGNKTVVVPHVHTHELCLDPEGNLYGEHLWYEGDATKKWGYRVWRLTPDGKLTDVIPTREGFRKEYSFVRDGRQNMYWAEGEGLTLIRRRSPGGEIGVLAQSSELRDVRWMTATPGGTIFLISGSDLFRISADGAVHVVARRLDEKKWTQFQVNQHHLLMGLWADPQENVFVAVYGAREVKRITPDGEVTVAARSGWPWSPTGGLVAPNGDLWLLEYSVTNAVRVRRIETSGKIRVY